MSAFGRYLVDAIVLEGRSPTELARNHTISRSRINQLLARFKGADKRPWSLVADGPSPAPTKPARRSRPRS